MDIFSFILGILYTFPLTVAIVCVGIVVFFYRNNLMKLKHIDNERDITVINSTNKLIYSSTENLTIAENKMKELPMNEKSALNSTKTNFNDSPVRDLFGKPIPEQLPLIGKNTPNLPRTHLPKKVSSLPKETMQNKNTITQNNKIWVQVYFNNKARLYHYFLGDVKNLKIGDKVIVYTKGGTWKAIATINYISDGTESPPPRTKSPISLKVQGKFLASKNGNKYHKFWCQHMKQVINDEAIWFENETQAEKFGYEKCNKCFNRNKSKIKLKKSKEKS